MAKGKRAAALFEVIQAAKQKEQLRAKGGGFLTPKWWFKNKDKSNGAAVTPAKELPKPVQRSVKARRPDPEPEPEPVVDETPVDETPVDETPVEETPVEETQVQETPVVEHAPVVKIVREPEASEPTEEAESEPTPVEAAGTWTVTPESSEAPAHHDFMDNEVPALQDTPVLESVPTMKPEAAREPSSNGRKPVDVGVDRGRQLIVMRFSYTSAAITSFALLVIVCLAILIGKSMTKGPNTAGATPISDIKKGPAFPDVLRVTHPTNDETKAAIAPAPKPPSQDRIQPAPPLAKQTQTATAKQTQTATAKLAAPAPTPTPVPTPAVTPAPDPSPAPTQSAGPNGKRIVGMQYVVIQSYPDPEDAKDAVDALKKAGIDATVERIPRYAKSWSCVVSTRGFDHTKNNPDFKDFMKTIQDASNSFARPGTFRSFQPGVITWKDDAK